MGNKEMDNELMIGWNKFKSEAKGKNLERAKQGYIEFCKMLDEVDFELVEDYIGNKDKVELVYKFDDNIGLNVSSHAFKRQTYKNIINFKTKIRENGDEFIKFVGLTNNNSLIAQIKTFDGGIVNIDINNYNSFNKSRQSFYDKLKEVNGRTTDCYKNNETKMNIYIDGVKLNSIRVNDFKSYTYKSIISFKNKLIKNRDEFVKFTRLSDRGILISEIKTFDRSIVCADISQYDSFNKSRQDTYDYCKSKGYNILSPYSGVHDKILIDFNCGHNPHWIRPNDLKNDQGCPVCSESKGEKFVRQYLERNNINFIQEYKFNDCKYKYILSFDFYIPNMNLCIEFDGIQHFEVSSYFGKESFELTQKRDKIKDNYCRDNGINLLRIPYWELENVEKILDTEFNRLGKELKGVV